MFTSRVRIGLVAAVAGTAVLAVGSLAARPIVPPGNPAITTPSSPAQSHSAAADPNLSDTANVWDARIEGQRFA